MLKLTIRFANSHQSLSASNITLCNVSISRDLLQAIIQFWNTQWARSPKKVPRDRNVAKYNEVWCTQIL